MSRHCQPEGRARSAGRGFTLVELLVVVSIIALLISILLPSLKTARDQAKTVACIATQGAIGRGGAVYQSGNNGWLAGSPGTSGSTMLGHRDASSWSIDEQEIPLDLVQVWDWATPVSDMEHFAKLRGDRWKTLAETYLCPSNQFLSLPWNSGTAGPFEGWPAQPMISYFTMRHSMLWAESHAAPFSLATPQGAGLGGTDQWSLPKGYAPRIERVGNPADNVFIADASRYTDDATGEVHHDIGWRANAGGGFSDGGPTLPFQYLRSFHPTTWPRQRRYAPYTYRHRRGQKLGVVVSYLDGHAAQMTEEQSRMPDPWWPKGSAISFSDMNPDTQRAVQPYVDMMTGWYRVPR